MKKSVSEKSGHTCSQAPFSGRASRASQRDGDGRRRPGARGLTFTEVLISVVIISITVTPVFLLFSTSRRTTMAARDVSRATSFAGSYITAIAGAANVRLREVAKTEDLSMDGLMALDKLGVEKVHKGFRRFLELKKIAPDGESGSKAYHARVTVEWTAASGKTNSYSMERLLNAKD